MSNPIVTITLENGEVMTGELYPDKAPNTVNNFIALANSGYYDGLTFRENSSVHASPVALSTATHFRPSFVRKRPQGVRCSMTCPRTPELTRWILSFFSIRITSNSCVPALTHQIVCGWFPVRDYDLHVLITQEVALTDVLAAVTDTRITEPLERGPVMCFFMFSTHGSLPWGQRRTPCGTYPGISQG